MLSYKGPVDVVYLGSQVNDCCGVNVFHSERGYDEFQFNIQGILSFGGTMNGGGEFLHRSGSPIQKS